MAVISPDLTAPGEYLVVELFVDRVHGTGLVHAIEQALLEEFNSCLK